MNGVDYSQKYNSLHDQYQKSVSDNNRNHKEEMEALSNQTDHKLKSQTKAHTKQIRNLETNFEDRVDTLAKDQKKVLNEKSAAYNDKVVENQKQFHEEKRDNIRNWNKKFSELTTAYKDNEEIRNANDLKIRTALAKNNKENVETIKKQFNRELNDYIATRNKEKKESDLQFRIEKNTLRNELGKEMNQLVKDETEKRNLLKTRGANDIRDIRNKQEREYIETKNKDQANFNKLTNSMDKKIDEQIAHERARSTASFQEDTKKRNIAFSDRYDNLAKDYNKNLRDIEFKRRAEVAAQGDVGDKIQEKVKANREEQLDLQRKTLLNERNDLVKDYEKKVTDTVEGQKEAIRDINIKNAEKLTNVKGSLTQTNRQDRFEDRLERERLVHENNNSLKYAEDKNADRAEAQSRLNETKINNLKRNFNKSIEMAQDKSKKDFENAQVEMIREKRDLQKRLHEQNSHQNSYLKKVYTGRMEKMAGGYERRIQDLENQLKVVQQSSNDALRDLTRKTNLEIERQRQIAQNSAATEVKTEKELSAEKEKALQKKIQDLQTSYTEKMNEQSLNNRKKLKDLSFDMDKKLKSEAARYQSIIDQNNKFYSRELERLKLATDTEKDRLVSQYEDRIKQLQKVYKNKTSEMEQFNKLNNA